MILPSGASAFAASANAASADFIDKMPDLIERSAHLYTQSFAFVASRNYASVIIGQHDYSLAFQLRLKDPFA